MTYFKAAMTVLSAAVAILSFAHVPVAAALEAPPAPALPVVSISGVSVTEVDSRAETVDAVFDVTLSAPTKLPVTVDFATVPGTAIADRPLYMGDFHATRGSLEFSAGDMRPRHVTVKVRGDPDHEGNETYLVRLSNPVNARLGTRDATGTIVDNDPVPVLTIRDATFVERDSATSAACLSVTLSNPTIFDVTYTVSTANGTATPVDYVPVNETDTIPAGFSYWAACVLVKGDPIPELDESVFVILDSPANAFLGNAVGQLTILNDDQFGVHLEVP